MTDSDILPDLDDEMPDLPDLDMELDDSEMESFYEELPEIPF